MLMLQDQMMFLQLAKWSRINENGDAVHMLTAQNKSIAGLTLTGTYYYAPDFT